MRLILIYGAPGTGKHTVATEFARLTDFTLFHNHMLLNTLSEIFGIENPIRRKLEKEFRLRIIEEALSTNMNILVTGVIMRDNEAFYRKMIDMVLESKGECILVQLTASKETLVARIGQESRKQLKKISTVERLKEWSEQYPESFEKIEFKNQVSIDTSRLSPNEVCKEIIKTFSISSKV